jgi:HAD superfamily hydrolase (TIGR01509 family)
MKIKLIIFDLDGVLVDSRDMHYEALNRALSDIAPTYVISREEHLSTYDGLSTTKKLSILSSKGLDPNLHKMIWERKQSYTNEIIDKEYSIDSRICNILKQLKNEGYLLYVASNSIHSTVKTILLRKGFMDYIDYFASNQNVKLPKPNPEIYFHCMTHTGLSVHETLILEDSHIGRKAALGSGAYLLPIENCDDLTIEKIYNFMDSVKIINSEPKWLGRCNVVIPMSGFGFRFSDAGYEMPKPFIDVKGKPMIQVVVENLGFSIHNTRFIFIVRTEHIEKYNAHYILNLIAPGCIIISTPTVTEGSACSILLAKEYIDNDEHLFIANSDQFVEWNCNEFMYSMINDGIDGGIATFEADSLKWSYVKLDSDGFVCDVAEKKKISNHATVGFYFWKKGRDFIKYANQMIKNEIRTNGEFYTCPVYNEAINNGKKIKIFDVKKMWGLGTPEDLEYFLQNYTGSL